MTVHSRTHVHNTLPGGLAQRATRLTLDLSKGSVYADINYCPLSGETGVYRGVKVTGVHQTAGGSWYLSGHMVGKGYRTFKIERILDFQLR